MEFPNEPSAFPTISNPQSTPAVHMIIEKNIIKLSFIVESVGKKNYAHFSNSDLPCKWNWRVMMMNNLGVRYHCMFDDMFSALLFSCYWWLSINAISSVRSASPQMTLMWQYSFFLNFPFCWTDMEFHLFQVGPSIFPIVCIHGQKLQFIKNYTSWMKN